MLEKLVNEVDLEIDKRMQSFDVRLRQTQESITGLDPLVDSLKDRLVRLQDKHALDLERSIVVSANEER